MYSHKFATVDQFVVKALREVDELPEAQTCTDAPRRPQRKRWRAFDRSSSAEGGRQQSPLQFGNLDAQKTGYGAVDLWGGLIVLEGINSAVTRP